MIKKYIGDLFIPLKFYGLTGICIVLFIISFFLPYLYPLAKVVWGVVVALTGIDYLFHFFLGKAPSGKRIISERLSNGDDNNVSLRIVNNMAFRVDMEIIDELPGQFQHRTFRICRTFIPKEEKRIVYTVRPVQRGVYNFGRMMLYVTTRLGLVTRRFAIPCQQDVAVYPSYLQLRSYQLQSHTSLLSGHGNRRMRKLGHSMEFEQIKDYVTGDDIRKINWKATARKGLMMVNHYTDEKSQQIYCVIDKGRLMKMPFAGLTLLDYAINSTLVLGSICLQKQDKFGLLTFSDRMGTVVPADRNPVQRQKILESLYKQQTSFLESDFEMLYMQVRSKIKQRSLLILYTNFESLNGLKRQVSYLRSIARHHLLLVVFFENTELTSLSHSPALNLEDVYVKTIAEKFSFEKRLIVKELQKFGILSILTSPEQLTVNAVNKYLELKTRQAI
jgi:uncharacterized protein (DUF58 family)